MRKARRAVRGHVNGTTKKGYRLRMPTLRFGTLSALCLALVGLVLWLPAVAFGDRDERELNATLTGFHEHELAVNAS